MICTKKALVIIITIVIILLCSVIPINSEQCEDYVTPAVPTVVQPETFTDVPILDEVEEVETAEKVETVEEIEEIEDAGEVESITFKVTAYCPCYQCSEGYGDMTATGVRAKAGRTIAVDPSVIPYGTKVTIGNNTYIAEDCGGAIKGNRLDIYFDSHQEASDFGVQYLEGVVDW